MEEYIRTEGDEVLRRLLQGYLDKRAHEEKHKRQAMQLAEDMSGDFEAFYEQQAHLSPGEKKDRKRMAQVATVYTTKPDDRTPPQSPASPALYTDGEYCPGNRLRLQIPDSPMRPARHKAPCSD